MSVLQDSYLKFAPSDSTRQTSSLSYSTQKSDSKESENSMETEESKKSKTDFSAESTEKPNGEELTSEDKQYVRELASIDANVRAHEAAHIAAGSGVVTGGASFTYTRGPDGKMYAVGGEVPISLKKGRTPEETIQNARQVVAAAMAPSDPSPQDYKVAASATQMEVQARSEQAKEEVQKREEFLKEQESSKQEQAEAGQTQVTKTENTRDSVDLKFGTRLAQSYQSYAQTPQAPRLEIVA